MEEASKELVTLEDYSTIDQIDLLDQIKLTPAQIKILKDTVLSHDNFTDDEVRYFVYISNQNGLNPLLRQIYAVKYAGKMSCQTGIDGYRSLAERSGNYAGGIEYTFNDGKTIYEVIKSLKKDLPLIRENKMHVFPHTATAGVYKVIQQQVILTTATVRWQEYYPGGKKAELFWDPMPFNQLGKCAEAKALRKSHPHCYKNLYVDAEVHRGIRLTPDQYEIQAMDGELVEIVNSINTGYTTLGLNDARMIEKNLQHTGKNDLFQVDIETLKKLNKIIKREVDKQNEK